MFGVCYRPPTPPELRPAANSSPPSLHPGDRHQDPSVKTVPPMMPSPPRQLPIRLHHILAQQHPTAAAYPQMASREPPRRTTTASGVRRNLFQHTASRRPATTASSTSGTSVTTLQVAPEEANADIAVRDEHGNYQLEQPAMTPMGRDEGRDERGMSRSEDGSALSLLWLCRS